MPTAVAVFEYEPNATESLVSATAWRPMATDWPSLALDCADDAGVAQMHWHHHPGRWHFVQKLAHQSLLRCWHRRWQWMLAAERGGGIFGGSGALADGRRGIAGGLGESAHADGRAAGGAGAGAHGRSAQAGSGSAHADGNGIAAGGAVVVVVVAMDITIADADIMINATAGNEKGGQAGYR